MSAYKSAQEHIVVELLRPDATALKYNDLGFEFLEENKITNKNMPFKVSVEKKRVKKEIYIMTIHNKAFFCQTACLRWCVSIIVLYRVAISINQYLATQQRMAL